MAQAIVKDHQQVLQRISHHLHNQESSVQKEELNSASMGKLDGPVS
jgi:hypothetical protein